MTALHLCPHCSHDHYWHRQRKPDRPDELFYGYCLCGCDYLKIHIYKEEIT